MNDLQEELRQVKHRIREARCALVATKRGYGADSHYADRHFAVAEQYLNLASLALAEGRVQMRDVE